MLCFFNIYEIAIDFNVAQCKRFQLQITPKSVFLLIRRNKFAPGPLKKKKKTKKKGNDCTTSNIPQIWNFQQMNQKNHDSIKKLKLRREKEMRGDLNKPDGSGGGGDAPECGGLDVNGLWTKFRLKELEHGRFTRHLAFDRSRAHSQHQQSRLRN